MDIENHSSSKLSRKFRQLRVRVRENLGRNWEREQDRFLIPDMNSIRPTDCWLLDAVHVCIRLPLCDHWPIWPHCCTTANDAVQTQSNYVHSGLMGKNTSIFDFWFLVDCQWYDGANHIARCFEIWLQNALFENFKIDLQTQTLVVCSICHSTHGQSGIFWVNKILKEESKANKRSNWNRDSLPMQWHSKYRMAALQNFDLHLTI